jgi:GDP-4-dehydro-6-deoxy-D-mannose reductase
VRALVTGASGFVGRHLVHHLEGAGDDVAPFAGVDVTDGAATREAIAAAGPEVVYHLAAQASVGASWSDPAASFRVNAEGTLHVLEACRAAGVDRVLVVSSAEVYGTVGAEPVREDAPLRPVSPYAASKVAAEYLGLQAHLGTGLGVVRVRPFNHTGPGQGDRFVVPAIARRVVEAERSGSDHVTAGNLDPERDFTDVRDVVAAYRLAVVHGEPGEVYNVCSGAAVTVRALVDALLAHAAVALRVEVDPALVRPADIPRLVGDPGRFAAATGWSPTRPIADTMGEMVAWWRAELDGGRPAPA